MNTTESNLMTVKLPSLLFQLFRVIFYTSPYSLFLWCYCCFHRPIVLSFQVAELQMSIWIIYTEAIRTPPDWTSSWKKDNKQSKCLMRQIFENPSSCIGDLHTYLLLQRELQVRKFVSIHTPTVSLLSWVDFGRRTLCTKYPPIFLSNFWLSYFQSSIPTSFCANPSVVIFRWNLDHLYSRHGDRK
jgi:hypothetical protein